MRLLASAMEFREPWLHAEADDVIDEVLTATARHNPALRGITLDRVRRENTVPLAVKNSPPFADGVFPTPSCKAELYSETLAGEGSDPLPGYIERSDDGLLGMNGFKPGEALTLITGASHHFVSSSLANQAGLLHGEGGAFVEIHPDDAAMRGIRNGQPVTVENGRGFCELQALVTDAVRRGVLVSPKGRWSKMNGGRNVNWTTPDVLGDMAGQSTFHSNQVWIRPAD
jgi:anaerobic selenocysteine-containing dehydrogenase